ncbi:MAG: insulinase family protein [bacterium]|nr:insulinase family protein [bacterium]
MYRRLQRPAAVAACALLIAAAATAAGDLTFPDLPPGAEVLRLENGLQVVLLPNPAQPMAAVLTQVRVGSAYEDFRTSGMSHMLEHLLFNGTATMTQEELYAAADRLGAWNNAHTSDFFTNFIMIVPSAKLAEGVALQAGMLFHSTLPADKFEKERGIVVGEIVQGRDRDEDPAGGILRDAAFAGSSLALPTLGTLSTIEHLNRDDVDAFYHQHYVPNNMITTVAGGFDRDAVLALLREHFGAVPPGTVQRPPLVPAPPVGEGSVVTRRAGDAHVLALVYEAPGYGDPDFFAFEALTGLLDAPANGVLAQAYAKLPEDRRPGVSTWWDRADGFARLTLRLDLPADADPALYRRLTGEALAAAAKKGFAADDVTEIVRGRATTTLLEREQLRMLAITAAEPLVLGGPDHFLGYLDRLAAVTPAQIVGTLERHLVGRPHLAVHVLPDGGRRGSGRGGRGVGAFGPGRRGGAGHAAQPGLAAVRGPRGGAPPRRPGRRAPRRLEPRAPPAAARHAGLRPRVPRAPPGRPGRRAEARRRPEHPHGRLLHRRPLLLGAAGDRRRRRPRGPDRGARPAARARLHGGRRGRRAGGPAGDPGAPGGRRRPARAAPVRRRPLRRPPAGPRPRGRAGLARRPRPRRPEGPAPPRLRAGEPGGDRGVAAAPRAGGRAGRGAPARPRRAEPRPAAPADDGEGRPRDRDGRRPHGRHPHGFAVRRRSRRRPRPADAGGRAVGPHRDGPARDARPELQHRGPASRSTAARRPWRPGSIRRRRAWPRASRRCWRRCAASTPRRSPSRSWTRRAARAPAA